MLMDVRALSANRPLVGDAVTNESLRGRQQVFSNLLNNAAKFVRRIVEFHGGN